MPPISPSRKATTREPQLPRDPGVADVARHVSIAAPEPTLPTPKTLLNRLGKELAEQIRLLTHSETGLGFAGRKAQVVSKGNLIISLAEEANIIVAPKQNPLALPYLTVLSTEVDKALVRVTLTEGVGKMSSQDDSVSEAAMTFSKRLGNGRVRILTAEETKKDVQESRAEQTAMRNKFVQLLGAPTP